jgi:cobalt-zinc-cadmium resistance protein CzcA
LDRISSNSRSSENARAIMSQVKAVTDLRVEKLTGMPQLRIAINRPAVARVGLTPGDVISAVRVGLAGQDMSEIWIGQRRFDLVLRLQDESRNDANAIRRMLIDGHDGTRIPLGQLADIEETFGPGAIRREAGNCRAG